MRSKTKSPCPRRAEVEILGVAICGQCARQQEIYLAIGELTDEEETHVVRARALAEALKMTRREGDAAGARWCKGNHDSGAASRARGRPRARADRACEQLASPTARGGCRGSARQSASRYGGSDLDAQRNHPGHFDSLSP